MKVLTRIRLPYPVILKSLLEQKIELVPDNNFSSFNITLIPNIDDLDEYYNTGYPNHYSTLIEIEAITNLVPLDKYLLKRCAIFKNFYNVGDEDRKLIFNHLRIKLNSFLAGLNSYSRMFWIESLPLNHLSGCIGTQTEYIFLEDTTEIKGSARSFTSIIDDFTRNIDENDLRLIDSDMLNTSKNLSMSLPNMEYLKYQDKSKLALYKYEFHELLIYMAISIETLMKTIVTTYNEEVIQKSDIVLNKLIDLGKYKFQEYYLNYIYVYIFKKGLYSSNPSVYKNLKDIFILRNAIMHGGKILEKDFKKIGRPQINDLTFELCKEIFDSFQSAIDLIMDDFKELLNGIEVTVK